MSRRSGGGLARALAWVSLVGLVSLLVACRGDVAPRFEQPPIIIVDVDTLRADHLGCYGYQRATSPNIDAFSRETAFFEWAFAQAPNTPPSQASILTGMYPTCHGRVGNESRVVESMVSLAEVLQGAGYETAAFVDGGLMVAGFGLEQGFALYDDAGGRLHTIGPKAKRWIEARLAAPATRDQPFLLLIHTYDTHSPYEVTPEPYKSRFLGGLPEASREFQESPSKVMGRVWNDRFEDPPPRLTEAELAHAVALYDGGILHVDAWFGEFVGFLKSIGVYDQAILVLISDHGDEFQEHGNLFHERLYQTVTRIPMMIRFPGQSISGSFHQVVESIDLMPTLLEAVDLPVPDAVQGWSQLPLIRDGQHRRKLAVSESPFFGRRVAVTSMHHRLLYTVSAKSAELYRFRNDREEQHDLVAEESEPLTMLERGVREWQRTVSASRAEPETGRELSDEEKEQLRALGYLD